MSSPCHTEGPRHDMRPADQVGTASHHFAQDLSPQQFFVEWEVPDERAATTSDYEGRPEPSPVDLRGIGAFLVGDFDLMRG